MAVIREHLASKGLGLFNDLQNEHSIVGNFPFIVMLRDFGTPAQKEKFIKGTLDFKRAGHLRPDRAQHGSDATHMETKAVRETRNGVSAGASTARRCGPPACTWPPHCSVFARTSGKAGDAKGITCVLVPTSDAGREDRGIPVDLQHADRPSARELHQRVGAR
jgi:acyl-CoA dehydrogenase